MLSPVGISNLRFKEDTFNLTYSKGKWGKLLTELEFAFGKDIVVWQNDELVYNSVGKKTSGKHVLKLENGSTYRIKVLP